MSSIIGWLTRNEFQVWFSHDHSRELNTSCTILNGAPILIASLIMLVFTRPFASKFINKGTVKTNADGLIGKKARVTAEINNQFSLGAAVVGGQEWTARTEDDECIVPVGTMVLIKGIRGVKLIVEPIEEK